MVGVRLAERVIDAGGPAENIDDRQKTEDGKVKGKECSGMLGPDPEGAQEEEPRAVWSPREVFNITFRTNHSNALLLLAGDARVSKLGTRRRRKIGIFVRVTWNCSWRGASSWPALSWPEAKSASSECRTEH